MTKHFLYMSLLCLMAMLSGCSVDDGESSTMNPQLDADLHPVLTFKGHYDNYWIGFGSELPDYLVNFDSDFQVVIHKQEQTLTLNQSLVEMFCGYRDTQHETVMNCYLRGYSDDGRLIVYGLEVPPMEWTYLPTGPEGQHIARRTDFSSQSEAIFNTYTGSLDIFLYVGRDYTDGVAGASSNMSYHLAAQIER